MNCYQLPQFSLSYSLYSLSLVKTFKVLQTLKVWRETCGKNLQGFANLEGLA